MKRNSLNNLLLHEPEAPELNAADEQFARQLRTLLLASITPPAGLGERVFAASWPHLPAARGPLRLTGEASTIEGDAIGRGRGDGGTETPLRLRVAEVGWRRFAMAASLAMICTTGALIAHQSSHMRHEADDARISLAAANRVIPAPSSIAAESTWLSDEAEFAYLLETSSRSMSDLRGEFAMLISDMEM